jgi:serine protease AprX
VQVTLAATVISVTAVVPAAFAATSRFAAAPSVGDAPAAPTAPARIEDFLAGELAATATPDARLVVLVSADDADAAHGAAKAAHVDPILAIDEVGVVAVQATPAQVEVLRTQPGVRYLQGNRPLATAGSTGPTTTRVNAAAELYQAADGSELDGSGVGIAIVDSGMAGDHPFYQGGPEYFAMPQGGRTRLRNLKQLCVPFACDATSPGQVDELYFVDETGVDTDVQATGGHGTHVTGIAGGAEVTTSNGVRLRGVAPGAALYGIGAGAGLFTLNASASLSWVLEHHADPCFDLDPKPVCPAIKVVNNSYGSPGEYDPEDVFAKISERLVLEGVTVVWAAGNGDDLTSTDPRPNDGTVNLTNPPGESPLPGVLMVANQNDGGIADRDGALADSSSRGERGRPETYPDLAAPGTSILSSCRPYLPICSSGYPDRDYGEIGGTSMAAPHVAGIVALLLEARPDLTPGQVEDVLEDTAYKFGDPSTYEPDVATADAPFPGQVRNADDTTSFDKGHGLVDLAAAIAAARDLPEPGAPGPVCAATSPQAQDVTGDAGQVGSPLASGPSQDTLDIETVRFSHDATADTFSTVVKVADLRTEADPPATGTIGEVYDVDFHFAGATLNTRSTRNPALEPSVTLVRSGDGAAGTSDETIADVTGAFDAEADTITVAVPVAVLTEAVEGSAFEAGTTITPGSVTAWRDEGAVYLAGDLAVGSCPFVVGGAATPSTTPAPTAGDPPAPGGDTGAAAAGPEVSDQTTVEEGTIPDAHVSYQCGGAVEDPLLGVPIQPRAHQPWADPKCPWYLVTVDDSKPYRYLDISLAPTGANAPLSDFDLALYDAEGAEVATSGNSASAPELITLQFVPAGTYRVVVQPFQTVPGATFRLVVRNRAASDPLPYR